MAKIVIIFTNLNKNGLSFNNKLIGFSKVHTVTDKDIASKRNFIIPHILCILKLFNIIQDPNKIHTYCHQHTDDKPKAREKLRRSV